MVAGNTAVSSAVCSSLMDKGCAVALADPVTPAPLARKRAPRTLALPVDPGDLRSTEEMVRSVAEQFGRIDVLVVSDSYNSQASQAPWHEIPPEEWDRCFVQMVRGTWLIRCPWSR